MLTSIVPQATSGQPRHFSSTQYGVSPVQSGLSTTGPAHSGPTVVPLEVSLGSTVVVIVGSVVGPAVVGSTIEVVRVGSTVDSVVVGLTVPVLVSVALVGPWVVVPPPNMQPGSRIASGATQPLLSTAHTLHIKPSPQAPWLMPQWFALVTRQPPASEPTNAEARPRPKPRAVARSFDVIVQVDRMAVASLEWQNTRRERNRPRRAWR